MKILVFNCMFLIVRQTLNEYLSRVSLHRLHISFIIVSACISFRWTWIVGFIKHLVSLFLSLLLHMSSVTISVSRWSVCCISLEHWAMIRRTIVAIQLWIGWAMIKKTPFFIISFFWFLLGQYNCGQVERYKEGCGWVTTGLKSIGKRCYCSAIVHWPYIDMVNWRSFWDRINVNDITWMKMLYASIPLTAMLSAFPAGLLLAFGYRKGINSISEGTFWFEISHHSTNLVCVCLQPWKFCLYIVNPPN